MITKNLLSQRKNLWLLLKKTEKKRQYISVREQWDISKTRHEYLNPKTMATQLAEKILGRE